MNETEYRIKELERKVRGMQVQLEKNDSRIKKHDKAIRDLEIKNAVQAGVSQRKVAAIYDLSAARVSQIAKKPFNNSSNAFNKSMKKPPFMWLFHCSSRLQLFSFSFVSLIPM